MSDSPKKWIGPEPANCQICGTKFDKGDKFVDGRLRDASWAVLCSWCHRNYGVGLGTGKGQEFLHS